jgi:hypothetical protein
MFGSRSGTTRVIALENGLIGWELEVSHTHAGDERPTITVQRGEETCGRSAEGLTRIARVAAMKWRELALELIKPW